MSVWGDYLERISGTSGTDATKRDRIISLEQRRILMRAPESPSFCKVERNSVEQSLTILDTADPHSKTICAMPGEDFSIGDYIKWSGYTWMVIDKKPNSQIYVKGDMAECNYNLRWVGSHNQMEQAMCCSADSTKYRNGVAQTQLVRLPDSQLEILLPRNAETLSIKRDTRVIIDTNPHTSTPSCYIVTSNNNIDFFHGEGNSLIKLSLEESAFNPATDDIKRWLADGLTVTDSESVSGDNDTVCQIRFSGSPTINRHQKQFTAVFTGRAAESPVWSLEDIHGNETSMAEIVSQDGDSVYIRTTGGFDDVGKTVVLRLVEPGTDCTSEIKLKIV